MYPWAEMILSPRADTGLPVFNYDGIHRLDSVQDIIAKDRKDPQVGQAELGQRFETHTAVPYGSAAPILLISLIFFLAQIGRIARRRSSLGEKCRPVCGSHTVSPFILRSVPNPSPSVMLSKGLDSAPCASERKP